jgi:hypothetical protein
MKIINVITVILVMIVIEGCTYSFNLNNYPDLKTIKIEDFQNSTSEFDVDNEISDYLSTQFRNDSRLRLVNENPDCQISGKIVSYLDVPAQFDEKENVSLRKIKIGFKIEFENLKDKTIIWDSGKYTEIESYIESGDSVIYSNSIDEARKKIYEKVFNKIIQNTLESW